MKLRQQLDNMFLRSFAFLRNANFLLFCIILVSALIFLWISLNRDGKVYNIDQVLPPIKYYETSIPKLPNVLNDQNDVNKEEKIENNIDELETMKKLTVENSVINQPCRRNTGILVQRMRDTQRNLNRLYRQTVTNITQRWELLSQFYGGMNGFLFRVQKRSIYKAIFTDFQKAAFYWDISLAAMNGFRYTLQPFKYYTRDEFKYFLKFSNPNAPCNHITLGVGGSWNGEKALRAKYPQCKMLGVDVVEQPSRKAVESDPNSRFIQALVSDKKRRAKKPGDVDQVALTDLLMNENEGRVIDFLTIDVEGAEYTLLDVLNKKRAELPVICQFNVEIHYNIRSYNVSWEKFDEILNQMFDEAHYVVLNADERTFNYKKLFLFNVADEECIAKFLC